MVKSFPDQSTMPRSKDGTEPIRGGSIGFNRILGAFEIAARKDTKPQFKSILISAFTIFRNVYDKLEGREKESIEAIEHAFAVDVNLFLEYFDTYLSIVKTRVGGDKLAPVLIYFPNYKKIPADLYRKPSESQQAFLLMYAKFLKRHGNTAGVIKQLENVICYSVPAGGERYPHRDVADAFKDIVASPRIAYIPGDPICLISHIPLDLYITHKLRNIILLESYTAQIKSPNFFGSKISKSPFVPFYASLHMALGDGVIIKQLIDQKEKKLVLQKAEEERWDRRSEPDIVNRLVKLTSLTYHDIRKYDFA